VVQPAPRTRQWGAVPTRIQPEHQQTSTCTAIPSTARQHNITRHAINILTLKEQALFNGINIPAKLMKQAKIPVHFEHYANLMVHPITGETILRYKKLMNDPATAKILANGLWERFWGNGAR
jgi:hypothetical protein